VVQAVEFEKELEIKLECGTADDADRASLWQWIVETDDHSV